MTLVNVVENTEYDLVTHSHINPEVPDKEQGRTDGRTGGRTGGRSPALAVNRMTVVLG